jgi:hypothetical protein
VRARKDIVFLLRAGTVLTLASGWVLSFSPIVTNIAQRASGPAFAFIFRREITRELGAGDRDTDILGIRIVKAAFDQLNDVVRRWAFRRAANRLISFFEELERAAVFVKTERVLYFPFDIRCLGGARGNFQPHTQNYQEDG